MIQVADQRWPKERRLRKRREIVAVRAGAAIRGRWFVAQVRPREANGPWRMAITVTRRVGNAVTRNRIKRWAREAARIGKPWPQGVDVVVIARAQAATLTARDDGFSKICADFSRLARAMG